MKPPSRPSNIGERHIEERHIEAFTVAMVVAPGVYVRNRMFDLFSSAGARRARTRASLLRGVLRQLARATALSLKSEVRGRDTVFVLRYSIPAIRLTRVLELSSAELAALRLVAERANVRCLPPGTDDKDLVIGALARLLGADGRVPGGGVSIDVARVLRDEGSCPVE